MLITETMRDGARMALFLDGWDRFSVWGYDAMGGHLFAQLWRNTDDPDGLPAVWITPGGRWAGTVHVDVLAEYVAMATGAEVPKVLLAMAESGPDPALEAQLRSLATAAA